MQDKWPDDLLDFDYWSLDRDPPNVLGRGGFLGFEVKFLYATAPHVDAPWLGDRPKLAAKVKIPETKLDDMLNMFVDVVNSIYDKKDSEKIEHVDWTPYEKYVNLDFRVDAEFNMGGIEGYKKGIFVDAEANGRFFGLVVYAKLNISIPWDPNVFRLFSGGEILGDAGKELWNEKKIKDWQAKGDKLVSFLHTVDVHVEFNVTLPFSMGEVYLLGKLNKDLFHIKATTKLQIGGFQLVDVHFEVKLVRQGRVGLDKDKSFFELKTMINMGPFGKVDVEGKVSKDEFFLNGFVNTNFMGLQFCGMVDADLAKKKEVQLRTYLALGPLGRADFFGKVTNAGVLIKADLDILGDAMSSVLKDAIEGIMAAAKNLLPKAAYNWIKDRVDDIVKAAVPVGKAEFLLDTISAEKKLQLSIEFTVLQGTSYEKKIVLADIDMSFSRRRLSGGRVPGREYTHVDAYMAELNRMTEQQTPQRRGLEDAPAPAPEPSPAPAPAETEKKRRNVVKDIENMDCPKNDFSLEDMVNKLIEKIDFKKLASQMGLCIGEDLALGSRCATDKQCKNSNTFPSGAYCKLDNKVPTLGFICNGECTRKEYSGDFCPRTNKGLDHNAACRSNRCICNVCTLERYKKNDVGQKCNQDANCKSGLFCRGQNLRKICNGKCSPYLGEGATCVSRPVRPQKQCRGECTCNKCTRSNGKHGENVICGDNSECDSGLYCTGHNNYAPGCWGKCKRRKGRNSSCGNSFECSNGSCRWGGPWWNRQRKCS